MPEFKFRHVEGLVAVPFEWERSIPYDALLRSGEAREHVRDFAKLVEEADW